MSKAKRNSLLFLSAAGVLILLLVMSLPTLTLSPGESFSLGKTNVTLPGVADPVPGSEAHLQMLQGLAALALVFLTVYIIYSLFSAEGRQRLVMNLGVMLILLWFINYLDNHPPSNDPVEQEMAFDTSSEDLEEEIPTEVYSEGKSPSWLAEVVILAASICSVVLFVVSGLSFRRRTARNRPSLHPLAETAQDTIEILRGGGDFKTAIIQCYREMNRVVREERDITRKTAMTPREFEAYLVSRGLPHHALETLTRLFEQARYGSAGLLSKTDDETMAFACLTEIVNTCKAATVSHDEP